MFRAVVALLFLVVLPSLAHAEKRVALVIGNSAYKYAGELANPKNDADDIAAALMALGVEVIKGLDLDKRGMDSTVLQFSKALAGADVGIFFYSGHGLQVNGNNYLVPVDAELSTAAALDFEMVRLDLVQRIMENEVKTNILFLDACRNNPLSRNLARALGTRAPAIGKGLAPAESGVGTLISFSTQPGNVALDGTGRNSPYTGPLVKRIGRAGEDVLTVLTDVRNEVLAATGEKQVPWENHALRARFYFNASPVATPATPQVNEAERAWRWVKDTTSPNVLENFIREFGDTPFGAMARTRLEALKRQQVTVAGPPSAPITQTMSCTEQGLEKKLAGAALKSFVKMCESKQIADAVPRPAALDRCDGVDTIVGNDKRCLKPKDTFKDCAECPEMVVVPSGSFVMGSPESEKDRQGNEGPQHKVIIGRPFAVGRSAVTRGEFTAFANDTGQMTEGACRSWTGSEWKQLEDRSWRSPGFQQDDRHPVVCVNWFDAKTFAAWLSTKTGKPYRLLSEAEREYATRAGTTTRYHFGNDENKLCQYGNGADRTTRNKIKGAEGWKIADCDDGYAYTSPVGRFAVNLFGIHDMQGNVWDWVEDCWNKTYEGAPRDSSAWTTGDCGQHVIRGGSWSNNVARGLRATYRSVVRQDSRDSSIGFRVARTLE